mmetsp:Transcript_32313/g.58956  ORF Transcript_32313/g.58956 Transcript_32313/m.58956 type:complete len:853 (-) Transcript_32313:15-2573(-)
MRIIAFAFACLPCVRHGRRVQKVHDQLPSSCSEASGSSPRSCLLAELQQARSNGHVGIKSVKMIAVLLLATSNAAAGWQATGHTIRPFTTPRSSSQKKKGWIACVGRRSSILTMCDGSGASGVATAESDLARRAGEEAVKSAVESQSSTSRSKVAEGRPYLVKLDKKPLGLVLAANPSGRGVFISQVLPNSTAAAQGQLQPGDYVTSVFSGDKKIKCIWLGVDEVQEAIEQTPEPVKMRVRRGGPEPWSLEREGSGLSVEEMVQVTKREYGKLLDDEKEDALRSAFAEIKEGERRAAAESATTRGYESESLKTASRVEFELRSFAQGVRNALGQVQQFIYNRALLDTTLAVQSAEYILRRSIMAVAALPMIPTVRNNSFAFLSFTSMERSIEANRALSLPGDSTSDEDLEELRQKEAEEAQAAIRNEAAALLKEAVAGVEAWTRQFADDEEATEASTVKKPKKQIKEPDWEALKQRASLLGGGVSNELKKGLDEVRRDFASFQRLAKQGQLPTVVEQLQETLPVTAGASSMPTLSAFKGQEAPDKQRQRRQKRQQAEREAKKLKFAAALGQRASEDGADALVFGVLPSAKAVGRMAGRRVAQKVAEKFGAGDGDAGKKKKGLVGELAQELSQAYKEDLKRGVEMGPLAEVADAFNGQKLAEDLDSLGNFLNNAVERTKVQDNIEKTRSRLDALKKGEDVKDVDEAQETEAIDTSLSKVEVLGDDEVTSVDSIAREMEKAEAADAAVREAGLLPMEEAVDVDVTSIEPDEKEEDSKRNAALLDAVLLTTESTLGTLVSNVEKFFTPEAARSWRLLNTFAGQESKVEQRAARAREKLLDELSQAASRRSSRSSN